MAWIRRDRTTAHRCRDCHWYAWRRCRVCEAWVCKGCRIGSGHWNRCTRCPYEGLAEVLRAHHEQDRAARIQEAARTVPGPSLGLSELGELEQLREQLPDLRGGSSARDEHRSRRQGSMDVGGRAPLKRGA